ncbi:MAG: response regulator transcription factor [Armatimonadetes bacterium]|nr:response regulator transcription factor [Armatimonadota bacterium]
MPGERILVVDDEPQIRRALRSGLAARGYQVLLAATGEEALDLAASRPVDLVILDLGLPDMEGVEVCRQLREWSSVPVIVLSVRAGDRDKVAALDSGADDYLTKPFSMAELLARIRAGVRRARAAPRAEPVFTTGALTVDMARHIVTVEGNEVKLTRLEYGVLRYLALNAGRVITHRVLLREVWGPEYEEETQYLRVHVGRIRRKIEPDPARPRYVITEPGVGYRLRVCE